MLPVNDMLLFVDVVKLMSFSGAAKKHGITAAAVSKRISFLEQKLNARLLNRTTRKLALTEPGHILFSHFEKIYREIEQAHTALLDTGKELKGVLRVRAPINLSYYMLSPLFAEFQRQNPYLQIVIDLDDARTLPPEGQYDLTIFTGMPETFDTISKRLTSISFVACGSPEYFQNHPIPKHPRDLKDHICLDLNIRPLGKIWAFHQDKEQIFVPIESPLVSNNAYFLLQMCLNGVGITYLSTFMVAEYVKQGKLIPVLQDYGTVGAHVAMYYHYREGEYPKKVLALMEFLSKHVPSAATVLEPPKTN